MFDTDFLSNWRVELKEMNKGKEGAKYRHPNSLIWLARHRTHIPVSIPRARRVSKMDVGTHRRTDPSTRFHNNVVESIKNASRVRSIRKSKQGGNDSD